MQLIDMDYFQSVVNTLFISKKINYVMESFFIVNTPYHILISIGLALQDKSNQDKHLILTADFNSVEDFYNSIVTWDNNPFSDIVILRGNYQMKGERFEYEKINFRNI